MWNRLAWTAAMPLCLTDYDYYEWIPSLSLQSKVTSAPKHTIPVMFCNISTFVIRTGKQPYSVTRIIRKTNYTIPLRNWATCGGTPSLTNTTSIMNTTTTKFKKSIITEPRWNSDMKDVRILWPSTLGEKKSSKIPGCRQLPANLERKN